MKKTIAVLLMIFVSMTNIYTFGESNQPLCYNISIDSSNQRYPVIYLMSVNTDSRNSITAELVLNDGQTEVPGVKRTVNITGSQTIFTLQIPDSITAGEYNIRFSSSNLQITAQRLNKYILTPNAGNVPNISLTPTSHEEGRGQEIVISTQMAVSDYTGAMAVLLNSQGQQVANVDKVIGSFKNGNCIINLAVTTGIKSGDYKVRVQVLGITRDIKYSITPSIAASVSPQITGLKVSEANLVEGKIRGNIVLEGKNFSLIPSRNTIEIINESGSRVGAALIPEMSNEEAASFLVPAGLQAGSYKVRITTEGKSAISISAFSVTKDDSPATTTPTPVVPGNEPSIDSLSLSNGAINIEGKISGSIIVNCNGFLAKPSDNRLHIIDSSGNEKALAQLDQSSTSQRLMAPIPPSLTAGRYRIKITVNSLEYIGNSMFEILKEGDSQASTNTFAISSLDMSGCTLFEGMIGGNAVINGSGFTSIPSLIEFVSSNGELNDSKASLVSYTQNSMVFRLPSLLKKGIYRIKVTISGLSLISLDSFEVAANPVVTTINGQDNSLSGIVRKEETTPPPIEVKIDNIKTTIDEKNNKSITEINGYQILSKIKGNEGMNVEVAFEIKDSGELTNEVLFNQEAVGIIVSSKLNIKLNSKNASIGIPLDIFKQNSSSVLRFVIDPVDDSGKFIETIPTASMKGLNLKTPVVDLKVFKENGPVIKILTDFTGNMELEFPVDASDDASDKRKMGIYYFHEANKTWEYLGGRYNKEKGIFVGETNHFTKFAVLEANISFTDVDNQHWARDYIEVLAAKHIVKGMGNNIFLPGGKVKRSEFATMIVKAFGIPLGVYQGKFKDVQAKDWFKLYVEALERTGIVKGTGNGYFSPNSEITNQEIAVMLINAYNYMGKRAQKTTSAPFRDMGKVAVWAKEQVDLCYSVGIIEGKKEDLFNPLKKASRADTCKSVYNLVKALGGF